jgi:hypothetical protein
MSGRAEGQRAVARCGVLSALPHWPGVFLAPNAPVIQGVISY